MDKKETGLTNAYVLINPVFDIYPLNKTSNQTLMTKPNDRPLKKLEPQKNEYPIFSDLTQNYVQKGV